MDFLAPDEELVAFAHRHGLTALPNKDDLRLAIACARGDPRALAHFDEQHTPVVVAVARGFGGGDFVTEVCQLVRQRLLLGEPGRAPRIGEYLGQGSLKKFVRAVAVRTSLNLLEAGARYAPMVSDDLLLETPAGQDDPELATIKLRYREEFKEAFAAAMAALDEASRNALRLHYLDGLTLAEVGGLYGWSVPTACRRIAAARARLLTATRELMGERLRLSPTELDSVLRLIESRLSLVGLDG